MSERDEIGVGELLAGQRPAARRAFGISWLGGRLGRRQLRNRSSAAMTAAAKDLTNDRIGVCLACHGAGGVSRVPETPSLAGQPQFFTIALLFLFRDGRPALSLRLSQSSCDHFASRERRNRASSSDWAASCGSPVFS